MHFDITWKTKYKNSELIHSNENGDKYTDINREDLESVEVYLKNEKIHTLILEENKRLIMRYRIQQKLFDSEDSSYVFLIGWQKTIDGKNTQEITCVFPDGSKEVFERWNNEVALYSEIRLRDDEK